GSRYSDLSLNPESRLLNPLSRLLERHAELAQQHPPFIIVAGRGHDGNVHALHVLDLVGVDLRKHHLLAEAEAVVAVAVERVRDQSANDADPTHHPRDNAREI